jgi:hypothetical protein
MNSIESNFVPYQIALDMKSIEFDEPCMYIFDKQRNNLMCPIYGLFENEEPNRFLNAPLYQQAFRWFREKYNLFGEIKVEDNVRLGEQKYYWSIFGVYKSLEGNPWIRCIQDSNSEMYKTYEEAELECLKKLISIVKEK